MPTTTADSLLSDSVTGFENNLSRLDRVPSRENKWQLERVIQIAERLLGTVEADFLGWQTRVRLGQQPFEQRTADGYSGLFATLARVYKRLYEVAREMERALDESVSHSTHLITWQFKAERLSSERIVPPATARIVFELTDEDADELSALLSAPPGAPGKLIGVPKQIPLAAPNFLS